MVVARGAGIYRYGASLAWPDPLCTGAYRLEIISAVRVNSNRKRLRDEWCRLPKRCV